MVEHILIIRISFENLRSRNLLSMIFAAALEAYVFVPNNANVINKAITELEKFIFPIPSGSRILEA